MPDLVVEVLSETNTQAEMDRKLKQYFEAGVSLVWYIAPETRSARVHAGLTDVTVVAQDGVLDGGPVLPGFQLSLWELFARADRQDPSGEACSAPQRFSMGIRRGATSSPVGR